MLKGFLEVAVFLERFRNIDLGQQGLYHLRLSVSRDGVYASPYDSVKTSKSDPLISLIPASGDSMDTHVSTSTFLIRYSEEEVQLRELWMFRFEGLPSEMDSLTLTAELCYSELDRNFSDLARLPARLESMESITFHSVSQVKVTLRNPKAGVLEPLVMEFDERFKAVVLGCVFCVMFDYKWRVEGNSLAPSNNVLPRSVADVLFTDIRGLPKPLAGADETDDLYHEFVHPQALAHELLRSYIADVVRRYIPLDERKKFADLPQPLSLPHCGKLDTQGSFSKAVDSHDPEKICEALLSEITYVAEEVHFLIQRLRDLLGCFPLHCMSPLFEKRLERLKNWSACSVKKSIQSVLCISHILDSDQQPARKRQSAETRRHNSTFPSLYDSPIDEVLGNPAFSPILFEESYYRAEERENGESSPLPKRSGHRKKHLFVLVHGLHGTATDMRLVKHAIATYSTIATVMCAIANEDSTERDIYDMGERLAREVKAYVAEWLSGGCLARISFIGYSLGGLIVRASFPHLSEYSSIMHSFISFSAPHLGHATDVSIVGAGLWVMERFNKSQLLQQLMLTDSADPKRMALYRLSQSPGLEWFRHVVFCSSYQDKYVPYSSARVQVSNDAANALPAEMAKNILQRILPERFMRIDVDFYQSGISLDHMTGRKAHLQFISSEHFLKLLIYQYPELFT